MKFILALVVAIATVSQINAQVKIDGPKEATVGYRVKAKLTLDVLDPQIKCFPTNDDWYPVQDLSGNKFIDFVPGKKVIPDGQDSIVFTFVVSGNKDNKTYLEIWQVKIIPDEESTPLPKPNSSSQLYKELLAAYKVAPNASALADHKAKLNDFLMEVKNDKYSAASAAGKGLASKFTNNDLKAVRNVVTDYLSTNVGNTWDKAKLIAAMTEIVNTINTIRE